MYNFRKVSLILSAAVLLFFSACRSASPETAAEELCSADRQTADGSCCLSFSDGSASFTAKRSGEALNISGEYFADEQKLSIVYLNRMASTMACSSRNMIAFCP